MNTLMYEHPLTAEHIRVIREVVGYQVVGPIGKKLACGDIGGSAQCIFCSALTNMPAIGMGAMTEWRDIIQIVVDKFQLSRGADTLT